MMHDNEHPKPENKPNINVKYDPLRLMAINSIAGANFVEVGRPSGELYDMMVEQLVEIANDKHEDRLVDYRDAIEAVVRYLQNDAALLNSGALNPLLHVVSMLSDTLAGSRPALLYKRHTPEKVGRPTDILEHHITASLALALSLLKKSKVPTKDAIMTVYRVVVEHKLNNTANGNMYTLQDIAAINRKIETESGPVMFHKHHKDLLRVYNLTSSGPNRPLADSLKEIRVLIEALTKHVPD